MFIQGVGTATPPHRYTQRECWEAYGKSPHLGRLSSRSQAILRKVLSGDSGIATRHFAMAGLEEAFSIDPDTLHRRFSENAPRLAAEAARRALDQAGRTPAQIGALVIATCTGYLCPGLTSYVSELLGLDPSVALFDLAGHGCGATLPSLRLSQALLDSGQARQVLSISVEICSAAFYLDNDPGVLISSCLFGDGAGALVLGREPGRGRAVEWTGFATLLNARDRGLLRFETRGGMLRNVLDKSVPLLVAGHLRGIVAELEARAGLRREEIAEWIVHAGGRDVLAALQSGSGGLGLGAEQLRWSRGVLRDYGNVSSPSVIFALGRALEGGARPGAWLMAAFGAGISCHGAILKVG